MVDITPPHSAVLSIFIAPPVSSGGIGSVEFTSRNSSGRSCHQRGDDTGEGCS